METTDCQVKVINVPGDGNCLFYAIVQQLSGRRVFDTQFYMEAVELRRATVKYLRDHKSELKNIILSEIITMTNESLEDLMDWELENKIEQHLRKLEQNGTWAGSEALVAIKEILRMNIRIYNPNYHPLELLYGDGSSKTLEIYYNGTNHYDSVDNGLEKGNEEQGTEEARNLINSEEMEQCHVEQNVDIEKPKITNTTRWINVDKYRIKVREVIDGEDSYLWAISHQLSGLSPKSEMFEELPKALWQDINRYSKEAEGGDGTRPGYKTWQFIAEFWKKEVIIFCEGIGEKRYKPAAESDAHVEGDVKLLQYIKDGRVQIDSVEMVVLRQKKNNPKKHNLTETLKVKRNSEKEHKDKKKELRDQNEQLNVASLNVRGCCQKEEKKNGD